jgi:F0F1-type ATP synthase membrane subunit b/b'
MNILETTKRTIARFRKDIERTEYQALKDLYVSYAYGAVELANDLLWAAHQHEDAKRLAEWWEAEEKEFEALAWGI